MMLHRIVVRLAVAACALTALVVTRRCGGEAAGKPRPDQLPRLDDRRRLRIRHVRRRPAGRRRRRRDHVRDSGGNVRLRRPVRLDDADDDLRLRHVDVSCLQPGFGLTELVSSWTADTPSGTWIQVEMQARRPPARRRSGTCWAVGRRRCRRRRAATSTAPRSAVRATPTARSPSTPSSPPRASR